MLSNNFRIQFFKNLGIISVINFISKLFSILSGLLLARLLEPSDFGIYGISLSIIAVVTIFDQMGLSEAVIQKRTEDEETLFYTGFFLKLSISFISFLILIIIAPLGSLLYKNTDIKYIIILLAFVIIINNFKFIPRTHLIRSNKLNKLFIPRISETFSYSITVVLLAVYGFKFWSFIYATIFSSFVGVIAYFYTFPWKIKLIFHWRLGKELLHFGKYLFLNSVVAIPRDQMAKLIIAKLLGLSSLGYFTFAQRWGTMFCLEFGKITNRVLFPINALYQDDLVRLEKMHTQVIKYISLIVIPVSLGFLILVPELVPTILGEKWMPAVIPLQIFSLYGLLDTINKRGFIYIATGKPQYLLYFSLIFILLLSFSIFPLTLAFSINGTCVAVLFSFSIARFGLPFWVLHKYYHFDITRIFSKFIIPLISSFIMAAGIFTLKFAMYKLGLSQVTVLVASVFLGVIIYTLCLFVFMMDEIINLTKIFLTHDLSFSEKAKRAVLAL